MSSSVKPAPSTFASILRFSAIALVASSLGGCAVIAVGSAAVDVASFGVKAATAVGGVAIDGASAVAKAGTGTASKPDEKKSSD